MLITNRGALRILELAFRDAYAGAAWSSSFFLALVTAATAPSRSTNTLSDLTEIAAGNGYTAGGEAVNRDATDWDTLTESDALDKALAQVKNITWTASGGAIPGSGNGFRYAVLLGPHATVANREVLAAFDLKAARTVPAGTTFALADLEVDGKTAF